MKTTRKQFTALALAALATGFIGQAAIGGGAGQAALFQDRVEAEIGRDRAQAGRDRAV